MTEMVDSEIRNAEQGVLRMEQELQNALSQEDECQRRLDEMSAQEANSVRGQEAKTSLSILREIANRKIDEVRRAKENLEQLKKKRENQQNGGLPSANEEKQERPQDIQSIEHSLEQKKAELVKFLDKEDTYQRLVDNMSAEEANSVRGQQIMSELSRLKSEGRAKIDEIRKAESDLKRLRNSDWVSNVGNGGEHLSIRDCQLKQEQNGNVKPNEQNSTNQMHL